MTAETTAPPSAGRYWQRRPSFSTAPRDVLRTDAAGAWVDYRTDTGVLILEVGHRAAAWLEARR